MTPDIKTVHRNEDGEQVTERHVIVEDATGETYEHTWRVKDSDHAYLGDGEPPESAEQALQKRFGAEFVADDGRGES